MERLGFSGDRRLGRVRLFELIHSIHIEFLKKVSFLSLNYFGLFFMILNSED